MQISEHGRMRSFARRLSKQSVEQAMAFGREIHTRGAVLYVIGRKEVEKARRSGIDLSRSEGIHVVCTQGDLVLTVYRNRNLRNLRPAHRSRSYRYNAKPRGFTEAAPEGSQ